MCKPISVRFIELEFKKSVRACLLGWTLIDAVKQPSTLVGVEVEFRRCGRGVPLRRAQVEIAAPMCALYLPIHEVKARECTAHQKVASDAHTRELFGPLSSGSTFGCGPMVGGVEPACRMVNV